MAAAVSGAGAGRAAGEKPGSAESSPPDTRGDRSGGAGVAAGAHALGTTQAETNPGARPTGESLAGEQHHGHLLKRAGLVVARKQRRRTAPYTEPLAHAEGCNRVWCADFKGWFRTGDGERIDPLTISDAYSRYLLRCQAVEKSNTERVRAIFEAGFREHGMPQAIRTDNGTPFASAAIAGLSR